MHSKMIPVSFPWFWKIIRMLEFYMILIYIHFLKIAWKGERCVGQIKFTLKSNYLIEHFKPNGYASCNEKNLKNVSWTVFKDMLYRLLNFTYNNILTSMIFQEIFRYFENSWSGTATKPGTKPNFSNLLVSA